MVLESFDVDAYAAKYAARNRTERLLFIAKSNEALRADAHAALLRDLKGGLNMKLYVEVAEAATASANAPPESSESAAAIDAAFVESVKRSAAAQHERLEQELNSYKSTMIKESIRVRVWTCIRVVTISGH